MLDGCGWELGITPPSPKRGWKINNLIKREGGRAITRGDTIE